MPQEKQKWGKADMKGPFGEKGYYSRDVSGKTVGFLVSAEKPPFDPLMIAS